MNPNRLVNLVPFKPGQAGNPSGRPEKPPKVRKLAKIYTVEALQLAMEAGFRTGGWSCKYHQRLTNQ
jgi:hypothetical protein